MKKKDMECFFGYPIDDSKKVYKRFMRGENWACLFPKSVKYTKLAFETPSNVAFNKGKFYFSFDSNVFVGGIHLSRKEVKRMKKMINHVLKKDKLERKNAEEQEA